MLRNQTSPFSIITARQAGSDYGSGEQGKGPNPSEHLEHPGPAAPDTGNNSSNSSKGSSGTAQQTSNSKGGGSLGAAASSSGGAQATIHKDDRPSDESADVKKHNEEMDKKNKGSSGGHGAH